MMIKKQLIYFLFCISLFSLSINTNAQCDYYNSISVSASGFESGAGYTQQYVLVNDVTDLIVAINSTGAFSSLTGGSYRIYAINYLDAAPSILTVGNLWTPIESYATSHCFDFIGPYSGSSITICEEFCSGNLVTTASGYTTGGSFEEKYVVVNSSGVIVATNTSGTFAGLPANDYYVYAVNTDDASVKAEINNLGNWSDVENLGSTICFDILGPRHFGCPSVKNYYWVGGTGNWNEYATHWATTSGGSTFNTSVPTSTDNVYFDANSGGGVVTMNVNGNVAYITSTNFTGSFAGSLSLTGTDLNVVSGSFNMNAINVNISNSATITGTVSISTGNLDVDGDFNATGGNVTFTNSGYLKLGGATITSLGTLTNNLGTVRYDRLGDQTVLTKTYNNLEINGSGNKTLGGAITTNGSLILNSGTLDVSGSNYAINVKLHWTNAGGAFTCGTGTVTFNGTSTQHVNTTDGVSTVNTSNFSFYNIIIDGSDVRFHIDESNYKKISTNNLTINSSKVLKYIKH